MPRLGKSIRVEKGKTVTKEMYENTPDAWKSEIFQVVKKVKANTEKPKKKRTYRKKKVEPRQSPNNE